MLRTILSALVLSAIAPAQTHTSGDFVGTLRPDSVIVWTRSSAPAQVSVLLATNPGLVGAVETIAAPATPTTDFAVKIYLTGLTPATRYWYATKLQGQAPSDVEIGPTSSFRTPPLPASDLPLSFAFSGDIGDFRDFGIFDQVRAQGHDFFISLGDFTYCDAGSTVAAYRDIHKWVRGFPALQAFFRSLGAAFIWDDHEVENDWHGGTNPARAAAGMQAWREMFPVPANETEIYKTLRWGQGVEVFLTDARSHRSVSTDPDLPTKTMLGAAQKAWLKGALSASTATWKVVLSSMPLRFGHGITDSWWYTQRERNEIFEYIVANKIENVVFLSADNHYAAIHHHREGVREYMVGPLAQFLGGSFPNPEPEVRYQKFELNWGVIRYDPVTSALKVEIYGRQGKLTEETLQAGAPGKLRIQSDAPECSFVATGPRYMRNSGHDVDLRRVDAGRYTIDFAAVAGTAGTPVQHVVDVPVGGDVRVACSYRGNEGPNPVLFTDTWDKPLSGWTIVDDATNLPSSWYTDNGYLWQSSNLSDGNLVSLGGSAAIAGDPTWSDYTVDVRFRSFDDDVLGVMLRWLDTNNHYRVAFDFERPGLTLLKKQNGVLTVLAQHPYPYMPLTWTRLQVVAVGSRLRVFVDGVPRIDVNDATFTQGKCGVYTGSNMMTAFDEFIVRQGDAVVRGAAPLFTDAFTSGSLAAWTVRDEGTTSAPSAWSVVAGVLTQTSDIYTPETPPNDVSRPGTMLLAGDPAWTDYRVTAKVKNNDDDGLGIVFRYQDPANYYRFSWDAERALRRLVQCVGGQWTVLKEDAVPYVPSTTYTIACQAVGPYLRVLIDGAPWTDLFDASLGSGRIGLYSWRSSQLSFDDVEVVRATVPRAVISATLGATTQIRASTAIGAGMGYMLALSLAKTPPIQLSLLNPGDPRVWPLAADPLFFLSMQPWAAFQGFRGVVGATGEINASIALPVVPALTGKPFFVGGVVLHANYQQVFEVLPSVELVFR